MPRILAIDFGRKRCGIAVTDPLCIIANPLATVETSKLIEYVSGYVKENEVSKVVAGYPRTVRGEDSETVKFMTPVLTRLAKAIEPVPIDYYDERFTSVLAHRAMIDGGMGKMARRDKAVVDRISASIILNDYLSSKKNNNTSNTI